jgi:hypothetical protein
MLQIDIIGATVHVQVVQLDIESGSWLSDSGRPGQVAFQGVVKPCHISVTLAHRANFTTSRTGRRLKNVTLL